MSNASSEHPASEHVPGNDGIVSSGWLAGTSAFGEQDERRIKRAFGASVGTAILHGVFLLVAIWLLTARGAPVVQSDSQPIVNLVYLQDPGPGGGGGGSPAPAPPREIAVPPPKAPEPIPIEVPPPPVEPPPPIPRLTAPVTTNSDFVQATGSSPVSLASFGGEGRGRGVGPGTGDGVGPGEGGGSGGGVYGPGSGVTFPAVLREVKPAYTSEAMRLKIQGSVELEITILADGTVGDDVRVIKSLDRVHGLDEAAKAAARAWLFRPAKDREGNSVAFRAPLILDFRLH
jgi:TonB family protein